MPADHRRDDFQQLATTFLLTQARHRADHTAENLALLHTHRAGVHLSPPTAC